jgi:hypothetical protein
MGIEEATKSPEQEPIRLELPELAPGHLGELTDRVAEANEAMTNKRPRSGGISSMHAQGRKLRLNHLSLPAHDDEGIQKALSLGGRGLNMGDIGCMISTVALPH